MAGKRINQAVKMRHSPETMQERRLLAGEEAEFGRLAKWVSGKGLCQRRAKRMTEPETAMAVARTTAWELKREDILVGRS